MNETESGVAITPAAVTEEKGLTLTRLAELPGKALLDETAMAMALSISKRTVRAMVARYELPPPQPFAGRSFWIAERVLAWIIARAERLEREAEKKAGKLWGAA